MYNVETQHEEYSFYATQWKMSEDFNKGVQSVKAGGKLYLPTPFLNPNDSSGSIDQEYEQFKEIAPFLGFTSKTQKGLSGTITRKPVVTENIAGSLEYLIDNANGGKLLLAQHVNRTVEQVTLKGRYGLLTELPVSNTEMSVADNANGAMPSIIGYKPDDIINWGLQGNTVVFIVLREVVKKDSKHNTMFGNETEFQYRVLLLEGGVYKQKLYKAGSTESFEEIDVTFNGQSFDYIPFSFVGSENNDETCDEAPMWPIVVANKDHYYNSALDQNITTCCSMMMLAISTSLDVEQQKEHFPQGITYGTRKGYFFGENDTVTVVQAKETSSASRKAAEILEGAKQIGAQLVEPSSNMTATEASIRNASDGSVMSQIAVNTESAYNEQLANISLVLGVSEVSTIEVNKILVTTTMTPEMRRQWVEEVMLGIIPKSDYYDALRKSEVISDSRTNKELENESQTDSESSDSISNLDE